MKKFSGKLGEWQEFWDSFESAIHLKDGLSKVDKFAYLRSLSLEPARSVIGGFPLTSANYESAIELLKKRYGKKIAIQRALVNEPLNARPVFKSMTRRNCVTSTISLKQVQSATGLKSGGKELLPGCRSDVFGKAS